jgi:site-specific recombinase XerD
VAPSSITIAVAALRFLYTVTLRKRWTVQTVIPAPREPQRVPVVLSPAEVVQFLEHVAASHHRAILTTCYAAGLRISEAVHLTLAAIASQRIVLRIEQGKGHQDRYVMLSPKLLEILRAAAHGSKTVAGSRLRSHGAVPGDRRRPRRTGVAWKGLSSTAEVRRPRLKRRFDGDTGRRGSHRK